MLSELLLAAAAAKPAESNSTEILVAILGSTALSSIVVAFVTGHYSRKRVQGEADKFGADASDIIQKAAAGVVSNIRDDNERIREEQRMERNAHVHALEAVERRAEETVSTAERQMRQMQVEHNVEMEQVRRVLQLHVAWDALAIAKLAEAGIDIPAAPPLLPPGKQGRGYTGEANHIH